MDVRPVWRAALGCPASLRSLSSGFRIINSDLGEAMGIRTPDLLHAMGNAAVHLPLDASQRRPVMLNTARATFRTTVRSRSKDLETTTDHMITSCPGPLNVMTGDNPVPITERSKRRNTPVFVLAHIAEYLILSEGGRNCRIECRSARSGRPSALLAAGGVVRHQPRLLPARSLGTRPTR